VVLHAQVITFQSRGARGSGWDAQNCPAVAALVPRCATDHDPDMASAADHAECCGIGPSHLSRKLASRRSVSGGVCDWLLARAPSPIHRSRGSLVAMGRSLWILIALCACGEPILRNAPKPDPGAVAGMAAAAATAATLADPQAAAKRQEDKDRPEPNNHGVVVKETVPSDVLDRADNQARADAGIEAP
jgi:hypothetical protein